MGGHGHTSKPGLPYPIPNPEIYKLEHVPDLQETDLKLKKQGLKDPWIRNHLWRYAAHKWGYKGQSLLGYCKRGFIFGYPLFIATIALERYYEIDYNLLGYDHVSNENRHIPPKHHS